MKNNFKTFAQFASLESNAMTAIRGGNGNGSGNADVAMLDFVDDRRGKRKGDGSNNGKGKDDIILTSLTVGDRD